MKNLLLIFFLFLISLQTTWAYEIKLSCNINQTTSYSVDGTSEGKSYSDIIDIIDIIKNHDLFWFCF